MNSKGMQEIEDYFNQIRNETNRFIMRLKETWEEEAHKAADNADREFGLYQEKVIGEIFHSAVDEFYSAYTPNGYERTGGLYDVLSLKTDERGLVVYGDTDVYDLFDKSKLHGDRRGGDLFRKVFIEGWHGGAENISPSKAKVWGTHPSPGTPYYRSPGFITTKTGRKVFHRWGSWGSVAVRTKSPYDIIKDNLYAAEATFIFDEFKRIGDKYGNEAFKNTVQKIPAIEREVIT